ncbi:MAG TPA: F0F1 ATP synthase subunit delta [Paenalcaligenes sp.]|nr:F0F1 ATP synthase subunit delta [Paenalcaligenes sp.]
MAELSTVARPYAEALFEHARDEGTLTQWSELLTIMAQVVAQHDVQEALNNPTLSHDQRYELFIGLLDTKLSDKAQNFIQLLIRNERLLLLPAVAQQFEVLRHKLEGIALAEITSAFELSESQVNDLVAALEKKFGLQLKAEVTIDPSLIGGVRVKVGDQVLDTSVQAQLAHMRDKLVS